MGEYCDMMPESQNRRDKKTAIAMQQFSKNIPAATDESLEMVFPIWYILELYNKDQQYTGPQLRT
jgi:hypothetical protein